MALPFKRPNGGGGGYLNGVTGTINAVEFAVNKTGLTKRGDSWTTISVALTVQPDGGDPVVQFLDAGFIYGDNAVSADKRSITGKDDYMLDTTTPWGQFVVSLVERESGTVLPEDLLGDLRNFDRLVGTRVTLARVRDEDATLARGARKLGAAAKTATREQILDAGKRVSKTDATKSYMLDKLLVADVVALPPAKAARGGGKRSAAPAAAAATPVSQGVAVDTATADAALMAILAAAKDGVLDRAKVGNAVLRYAVANKLPADDRDALRAMFQDDAYLTAAAARDVVILDGAQLLAAA